eukprot:Transcript_1158.p2 GENE.Transcript_1158~~Transcript_1158.p2  ORF type:complete len:234 (+),score=76.77 Transcript_1158:55-756(+)
MIATACRAVRAPAVSHCLLRQPRCGFKIYTRTGDEGSSSLFNGERRGKDHQVFEALGDSDELNAAIGLARAHCEVQSRDCIEGGRSLHDILSQLDTVQSRLLDVGSAVATPRSSSNDKQLERVRFGDDGESVRALEQWMDELDEELPPLRNFILPSGGLAASSLHVARAVCRRAERSITRLVQADECEHAVGVYVNRLSDYLFVAARTAAARGGAAETVYQKPRVHIDASGGE